MMIKYRRLGATAVAVALAGSALAACSSGSGSSSDAANQKVTITVGDMPAPDQKATLENFKKTVALFEKANPNITVKPQTTVWDPQTFQAAVAGGTLPTEMKVPFTEIQSLITRHQVADVTDALKTSGIKKDLSPNTAKVAEADGRDYGIPVAPYAVGLFYNRSLFEKAGLDPDKPPTTWDEVRKDAKAIAGKTGQAGYATMSTENTGGWMLAAQMYSMGGSLESADGKKATFDSPSGKRSLTYLQQMRWTDKSMGSKVLYNMKDIEKDFAAGRIGMYLDVPSAAYSAIVTTNKMPQKDVGLGATPTGPGADGSVLAGGSVDIVSPKATEAQKLAAVKWSSYLDLNSYLDKNFAVTHAKAVVADGSPVGVPRVSPVSDARNQQYQEWMKPYVNVPLDQMAGYTAALPKQKLKPEAPNQVQQVYADLDTVMQKVLSSKGANISSLLASATKTVDTQLARGDR
jgi:ABC-type glycerol-3-phosphate transport system substrate-binding protein